MDQFVRRRDHAAGHRSDRAGIAILRRHRHSLVEERSPVAWRPSAIALAILALFGAGGAPLLGAFDITLPAFRIAGELLLFTISFETVFGRRTKRKFDADEFAMREQLLRTLAVFPPRYR